MTIHIYIYTCMYTILLWFTFAQYHKHYNLNSLLLLNLSCPILIVVSEQNYYTHRYIHICILIYIYYWTDWTTNRCPTAGVIAADSDLGGHQQARS